MDRRSFIRAGAIGTAATALAAPAIAQGNITWRMVTTWPKNFPGIGVGAQRIADRITAASGGRLSIQVFSAGELVPPLQSLDAVIDGTAEMSHSAAYYWHNKSPALSFFTGVPYGMTTGELSAWMRHLGGQEIWDEIYDQFGVQGFLSGNTGVQAGGWFRDEVTSVDSIKGVRFRTPGLGGEVWKKLGATVTNLAAGDIFQALQSGTLDAAEFVGPYNDLALGFHQVAKNYYMPSFVEAGLATELVVDKAKYQELPDDLQAIIRDISQAEYDQVSADFIANDPRALKTLVEDHGVQVRAFPDDLMEAGAAASKEVFEELRSSDDALVRKAADSFAEALDLVRTRTEKLDTPYQVSRKKYLNL